MDDFERFEYRMKPKHEPTPKMREIANKRLEEQVKAELVHAFNGRDLNFSSDDIRYFYKRITGKSWRGTDEDCLNGLIMYLIQIRKTL